MAAGGFKFGQSSATYDSSTYSTKRDWALDVHRARCDAFFLAQYREGDNWSSVTGGGTTITESRTVGTVGSYTLYILDLHPTSSDTTGAYPAFVTIWQSGNEEYAIITSNGMHWYSGWSSDVTRGLYINGIHLPNTSNSTSYKYVFYSLAHSFAKNGFSAYSFDDSSIESSELPVFPICGWDGRTRGETSPTADTYSSMIYQPTQGVTYSFGYAIRGSVIECFYKTSEYSVNSGWNWSIIGDILGDPSSGYSTAYYTYYNSSDRETYPISDNYYPRYSGSGCAFACIDFEEGVFPPPLLSTNVSRYPCLRPSYIPARCNSSTPGELLFSAGCLAFCKLSGIPSPVESSDGVDGNGNCVIGLIDTDILRIVPSQACTVGGAVYQGGNFVVPCKQAYITNSDDFGILLGWDSSNESIV